MMALSEKQQAFAKNVANLIQFINGRGYGVTFGEALRTQEMADIYAKQGKGIKNSLHLKKLAIDLNLFKDGVYLTATEDWKQFGEYWEALDPCNRWGGNFSKPDGNHLEMMEAPRGLR